MKKVSDLAEHELDAWVLMARHPSQCKRSDGWAENYVKRFQYHPSSDWNIGGMIIEREKIRLWYDGIWWYGVSFGAETENEACIGSTPLIAAMRAYVASVYGEHVSE